MQYAPPMSKQRPIRNSHCTQVPRLRPGAAKAENIRLNHAPRVSRMDETGAPLAIGSNLDQLAYTSYCDSRGRGRQSGTQKKMGPRKKQIDS